jgi:hypothetical protein
LFYGSRPIFTEIKPPFGMWYYHIKHVKNGTFYYFF